MKGKPFSLTARSIALFVLLAFSLNTAAWPAPLPFSVRSPEVSLEAKSPLSGFWVPPELGTIDEIERSRKRGPAPFVIHIQTAHGNYEAAKKIEALLRHFEKEYRIRLILLEGAAGRLDPGLDRYFREEKWNRQVLEYRAKQGRASGASLFLLDQPDSLQAWGMESPGLYRNNRKTFQEAHRAQERAQGALGELNREVGNRVSRLAKPLRVFLDRREAFESGRFSPVDYFSFLHRTAKHSAGLNLNHPAAQKDWPHLSRLARLQTLEKSLDRQKMEEEKEAFFYEIQRLLPAPLLEELKNLLEKPSSLPRAHVRFLLERVVDLLPESYSIDRYPSLKAKLESLAFQNEIRGEALFEELEQLADRSEAALAGGDKETEETLAFLKDHQLIKRLFSLELTPRDYERMEGTELRKLSAAVNLNPPKGSGAISSSGMAPPRQESGRTRHDDGIEQLFEKAMEFYRGAKTREKRMAENFLPKVRSSERPVVVITGGFHAPGLAEIFRSEGIAFARISPKLTEDGARQGYLDSMLEKRPAIFEQATVEDALAYPEIPPAILRRLGVDLEVARQWSVWDLISSGVPLNPSTMGEINQTARRRGFQIKVKGPDLLIWDSAKIHRVNLATRRIVQTRTVETRTPRAEKHATRSEARTPRSLPERARAEVRSPTERIPKRLETLMRFIVEDEMLSLQPFALSELISKGIFQEVTTVTVRQTIYQAIEKGYLREVLVYGGLGNVLQELAEGRGWARWRLRKGHTFVYELTPLGEKTFKGEFNPGFNPASLGAILSQTRGLDHLMLHIVGREDLYYGFTNNQITGLVKGAINLYLTKALRVGYLTVTEIGSRKSQHKFEPTRLGVEHAKALAGIPSKEKEIFKWWRTSWPFKPRTPLMPHIPGSPLRPDYLDDEAFTRRLLGWPELTGNEKTALKKRYGLENKKRFATLEAIGVELGLTGERVRQILASAKEKADYFRRYLQEEVDFNRLNEEPVLKLGYFSPRVRKTFEKLKIRFISDILEKTEDDLLENPQFGQAALQKVKTKLAGKGLSLRSPPRAEVRSEGGGMEAAHLVRGVEELYGMLRARGFAGTLQQFTADLKIQAELNTEILLTKDALGKPDSYFVLQDLDHTLHVFRAEGNQSIQPHALGDGIPLRLNQPLGQSVRIFKVGLKDKTLEHTLAMVTDKERKVSLYHLLSGRQVPFGRSPAEKIITLTSGTAEWVRVVSTHPKESSTIFVTNPDVRGKAAGVKAVYWVQKVKSPERRGLPVEVTKEAEKKEMQKEGGRPSKSESDRSRPLRGPWAQFTYSLDGGGEILEVKAGELPSEGEQRLPGQPPRGREYAFDLRIKANPRNEDALGRLKRFQKRLGKVSSDPRKLFLPPDDAFHIALAGRYPEQLEPLSQELVDKAYDVVQQRIKEALKAEPPLTPLTIEINGVRLTDNGTIVLDFEPEPLLARLRGMAFDALMEAGWKGEETRILRTEKGEPSEGGILTLARIVPNQTAAGFLMTPEELKKIRSRVSVIKGELQRSPIEIHFEAVSFIQPTREFLSEGWETERLVPLTPRAEVRMEEKEISGTGGVSSAVRRDRQFPQLRRLPVPLSPRQAFREPLSLEVRPTTQQRRIPRLTRPGQAEQEGGAWRRIPMQYVRQRESSQSLSAPSPQLSFNQEVGRAEVRLAERPSTPPRFGPIGRRAEVRAEDIERVRTYIEYYRKDMESEEPGTRKFAAIEIAEVLRETTKYQARPDFLEEHRRDLERAAQIFKEQWAAGDRSDEISLLLYDLAEFGTGTPESRDVILWYLRHPQKNLKTSLWLSDAIFDSVALKFTTMLDDEFLTELGQLLAIKNEKIDWAVMLFLEKSVEKFPIIETVKGLPTWTREIRRIASSSKYESSREHAIKILDHLQKEIPESKRPSKYEGAPWELFPFKASKQAILQEIEGKAVPPIELLRKKFDKKGEGKRMVFLFPSSFFNIFLEGRLIYEIGDLDIQRLALPIPERFEKEMNAIREGKEPLLDALERIEQETSQIESEDFLQSVADVLNIDDEKGAIAADDQDEILAFEEWLAGISLKTQFYLFGSEEHNQILARNEIVRKLLPLAKDEQKRTLVLGWIGDPDSLDGFSKQIVEPSESGPFNNAGVRLLDLLSKAEQERLSFIIYESLSDWETFGLADWASLWEANPTRIPQRFAIPFGPESIIGQRPLNNETITPLEHIADGLIFEAPKDEGGGRPEVPEPPKPPAVKKPLPKPRSKKTPSVSRAEVRSGPAEWGPAYFEKGNAVAYMGRLHEKEEKIQAVSGDEPRLKEEIALFISEFVKDEHVVASRYSGPLLIHSLTRLFGNESIRRAALEVVDALGVAEDYGQAFVLRALAQFKETDPEVQKYLESVLQNRSKGLAIKANADALEAAREFLHSAMPPPSVPSRGEDWKGLLEAAPSPHELDLPVSIEQEGSHLKFGIGPYQFRLSGKRAYEEEELKGDRREFDVEMFLEGEWRILKPPALKDFILDYFEEVDQISDEEGLLSLPLELEYRPDNPFPHFIRIVDPRRHVTTLFSDGGIHTKDPQGYFAGEKYIVDNAKFLISSVLLPAVLDPSTQTEALDIYRDAVSAGQAIMALRKLLTSRAEVRQELRKFAVQGQPGPARAEVRQELRKFAVQGQPGPARAEVRSEGSDDFVKRIEGIVRRGEGMSEKEFREEAAWLFSHVLPENKKNLSDSDRKAFDLAERHRQAWYNQSMEFKVTSQQQKKRMAASQIKIPKYAELQDVYQRIVENPERPLDAGTKTLLINFAAAILRMRKAPPPPLEWAMGQIPVISVEAHLEMDAMREKFRARLVTDEWRSEFYDWPRLYVGTEKGIIPADENVRFYVNPFLVSKSVGFAGERTLERFAALLLDRGNPVVQIKVLQPSGPGEPPALIIRLKEKPGNEESSVLPLFLLEERLPDFPEVEGRTREEFLKRYFVMDPGTLNALTFGSQAPLKEKVEKMKELFGKYVAGGKVLAFDHYSLFSEEGVRHFSDFIKANDEEGEAIRFFYLRRLLAMGRLFEEEWIAAPLGEKEIAQEEEKLVRKFQAWEAKEELAIQQEEKKQKEANEKLEAHAALFRRFGVPPEERDAARLAAAEKLRGKQVLLDWIESIQADERSFFAPWIRLFFHGRPEGGPLIPEKNQANLLNRLDKFRSESQKIFFNAAFAKIRKELPGELERAFDFEVLRALLEALETKANEDPGIPLLREGLLAAAGAEWNAGLSPTPTASSFREKERQALQQKGVELEKTLWGLLLSPQAENRIPEMEKAAQAAEELFERLSHIPHMVDPARLPRLRLTSQADLEADLVQLKESVKSVSEEVRAFEAAVQGERGRLALPAMLLKLRSLLEEEHDEEFLSQAKLAGEAGGKFSPEIKERFTRLINRVKEKFAEAQYLEAEQLEEKKDYASALSLIEKAEAVAGDPLGLFKEKKANLKQTLSSQKLGLPDALVKEAKSLLSQVPKENRIGRALLSAIVEYNRQAIEKNLEGYLKRKFKPEEQTSLNIDYQVYFFAQQVRLALRTDDSSSRAEVRAATGELTTRFESRQTFFQKLKVLFGRTVNLKESQFGFQFFKFFSSLYSKFREILTQTGQAPAKSLELALKVFKDYFEFTLPRELGAFLGWFRHLGILRLKRQTVSEASSSVKPNFLSPKRGMRINQDLDMPFQSVSAFRAEVRTSGDREEAATRLTDESTFRGSASPPHPKPDLPLDDYLGKVLRQKIKRRLAEKWLRLKDPEQRKRYQEWARKNFASEAIAETGRGTIKTRVYKVFDAEDKGLVFPKVFKLMTPDALKDRGGPPPEGLEKFSETHPDKIAHTELVGEVEFQGEKFILVAQDWGKVLQEEFDGALEEARRAGDLAPAPRIYSEFVSLLNSLLLEKIFMADVSLLNAVQIREPDGRTVSVKLVDLEHAISLKANGDYLRDEGGEKVRNIFQASQRQQIFGFLQILSPVTMNYSSRGSRPLAEALIEEIRGLSQEGNVLAQFLEALIKPGEDRKKVFEALDHYLYARGKASQRAREAWEGMGPRLRTRILEGLRTILLTGKLSQLPPEEVERQITKGIQILRLMAVGGKGEPADFLEVAEEVVWGLRELERLGSLIERKEFVRKSLDQFEEALSSYLKKKELNRWQVERLTGFDEELAWIYMKVAPAEEEMAKPLFGGTAGFQKIPLSQIPSLVVHLQTQLSREQKFPAEEKELDLTRPFNIPVYSPNGSYWPETLRTAEFASQEVEALGSKLQGAVVRAFQKYTRLLLRKESFDDIYPQLELSLKEGKERGLKFFEIHFSLPSGFLEQVSMRTKPISDATPIARFGAHSLTFGFLAQPGNSVEFVPYAPSQKSALLVIGLENQPGLEFFLRLSRGRIRVEAQEEGPEGIQLHPLAVYSREGGRKERILFEALRLEFLKAAFPPRAEVRQELRNFAVQGRPGPARGEVRMETERNRFYTPEQISWGMQEESGEKAMLLALFERYAREKGFVVNIPEFFVIPKKEAERIAMEEVEDSFSHDTRLALENHLRVLGEKTGRRFGDGENPLLVSVRTSPSRITPGQFLTVLNVGLNDQTVKGLAEQLQDTPLAYMLYAKLIEDFLVDIHNFLREDLRARTSRIQDASTKLRAYKTIYMQMVGSPFPQDGFEQMRMVMRKMPFVFRYRPPAERLFHPVMIQRQVFGVGADSFAGEVASHHPVTGERALSANLEASVQGDMTTGIMRVDNPIFKERPPLREELKTILEYGVEFLKDTAQGEFTIENRVPYLLQIRRPERNDEAEAVILIDLLRKKVLTPEETYERGRRINLGLLRTERKLVRHGGLRRIGKGNLVSPGAASAKMVMSDAGVFEAAVNGIPFILVKPEIRAHDHEALGSPSARGVISLLQIGAHAESGARGYGIVGVVGIPFKEADFDEGRVVLIDEQGNPVELKEKGESPDFLSIDSDGTVYQGKAEVIEERRKELPRDVAEFIALMMKSQGKRPAYRVLRWKNAWQRGPDDREEALIPDEEYEKGKRLDEWTGSKSLIISFLDVVEEAGPPSSPEPSPPIKIEKRRVSEEAVNEAVRLVIQKSGDEQGFLYELWYRQGHLDLLDYQREHPQAISIPSSIEYTNLPEAQLAFLRTLAGSKVRGELIHSAFVAMERHKPYSVSFRRLILESDRDFSENFFQQLVKAAIQAGYAANDYTMGRMLAEFIKAAPEFFEELFRGLPPEERGWILKELFYFYAIREFQSRTADPALPSPSELNAFIQKGVLGRPEVEVPVSQERYPLEKSAGYEKPVARDDILAWFQANSTPRAEVRQELRNFAVQGRPGPARAEVRSPRESVWIEYVSDPNRYLELAQEAVNLHQASLLRGDVWAQKEFFEMAQVMSMKSFGERGVSRVWAVYDNEKDRNLVGLRYVTELKTPLPGAPYLDLAGVKMATGATALLPEYQQRGIGKTLFKETLEYLRDQKVDLYVTGIERENVQSLRVVFSASREMGLKIEGPFLGRTPLYFIHLSTLEPPRSRAEVRAPKYLLLPLKEAQRLSKEGNRIAGYYTGAKALPFEEEMKDWLSSAWISKEKGISASGWVSAFSQDFGNFITATPNVEPATLFGSVYEHVEGHIRAYESDALPWPGCCAEAGYLSYLAFRLIDAKLGQIFSEPLSPQAYRYLYGDSFIHLHNRLLADTWIFDPVVRLFSESEGFQEMMERSVTTLPRAEVRAGKRKVETVELKLITKADMKQVLEMPVREGEKQLDEASLKAFLEDKSHEVFSYMLRYGNEVAGRLIYRAADRRLIVLHAAFHRDYRNRGIEKEVVKYLKDLLPKRGASGLDLFTIYTREFDNAGLDFLTAVRKTKEPFGESRLVRNFFRAPAENAIATVFVNPQKTIKDPFDSLSLKLDSLQFNPAIPRENILGIALESLDVLRKEKEALHGMEAVYLSPPEAQFQAPDRYTGLMLGVQERRSGVRSYQRALKRARKLSGRAAERDPQALFAMTPLRGLFEFENIPPADLFVGSVLAGYVYARVHDILGRDADPETILPLAKYFLHEIAWSGLEEKQAEEENREAPAFNEEALLDGFKPPRAEVRAGKRVEEKLLKELLVDIERQLLETGVPPGETGRRVVRDEAKLSLEAVYQRKEHQAMIQTRVFHSRKGIEIKGTVSLPVGPKGFQVEALDPQGRPIKGAEAVAGIFEMDARVDFKKNWQDSRNQVMQVVRKVRVALWAHLYPESLTTMSAQVYSKDTGIDSTEQFPIPRPDELIEFYKGFDAEGWKRVGQGGISVGMLQLDPGILTWYLSLINDLGRNLKIISLGAGRGQLEAAAQKNGHQVTAVELSEENAKYLRELGIKTIAADAHTLAEPQEKFDLVILIDSIGQMDPSRIMEAAKRQLKEGGRILITLPRTRQPMTQKEYEESKLVRYSRRFINKVLKSAGFVTESMGMLPLSLGGGRSDVTLEYHIAKLGSRAEVRVDAQARRDAFVEILNEQERNQSAALSRRELIDLIRQKPGFENVNKHDLRNDIEWDSRIANHPLLKTPSRIKPKKNEVQARRDTLLSILEELARQQLTVTPKKSTRLIRQKTGFERVKLTAVLDDLRLDNRFKDHPALKVVKLVKPSKIAVLERRRMLLSILDELAVSDQSPVSPSGLTRLTRQKQGYESLQLETVFNDIARTPLLKNHPKLQVRKHVLAEKSYLQRRRNTLLALLDSLTSSVTAKELTRMIREKPGFEEVTFYQVDNDLTLDRRLKNHSRIIRWIRMSTLRRREILLGILDSITSPIDRAELLHLIRQIPEFENVTEDQIRIDTDRDMVLARHPMLQVKRRVPTVPSETPPGLLNITANNRRFQVPAQGLIGSQPLNFRQLFNLLIREKLLDYTSPYEIEEKVIFINRKVQSGPGTETVIKRLSSPATTEDLDVLDAFSLVKENDQITITRIKKRGVELRGREAAATHPSTVPSILKPVSISNRGGVTKIRLLAGRSEVRAESTEEPIEYEHNRAVAEWNRHAKKWHVRRGSQILAKVWKREGESTQIQFGEGRPISIETPLDLLEFFDRRRLHPDIDEETYEVGVAPSFTGFEEKKQKFDTHYMDIADPEQIARSVAKVLSDVIRSGVKVQTDKRKVSGQEGPTKSVVINMEDGSFEVSVRTFPTELRVTLERLPKNPLTFLEFTTFLGPRLGYRNYHDMGSRLRKITRKGESLHWSPQSVRQTQGEVTPSSFVALGDEIHMSRPKKLPPHLSRAEVRAKADAFDTSENLGTGRSAVRDRKEIDFEFLGPRLEARRPEKLRGGVDTVLRTAWGWLDGKFLEEDLADLLSLAPEAVEALEKRFPALRKIFGTPPALAAPASAEIFEHISAQILEKSAGADKGAIRNFLEALAVQSDAKDGFVVGVEMFKRYGLLLAFWQKLYKDQIRFIVLEPENREEASVVQRAAIALSRELPSEQQITVQRNVPAAMSALKRKGFDPRGLGLQADIDLLRKVPGFKPKSQPDMDRLALGLGVSALLAQFQIEFQRAFATAA